MAVGMTDKKRMPNMELLRCLAMMMVVVLHYLGKGNLLPAMAGESTSGEIWFDWTGTLAWMLEILAIVAVNLYMLISGYFLCNSSFKLSRLLALLIRLWIYSMLFGVLSAGLGIVAETPVDTHYFLTLMFPVSMNHYWFMTAYLFLYVCLPFVGAAVKRMTKSQLGTACILMLMVFCVTKSILPFRLETDLKGYDFVWYLCVFLAAAYIRRFGLPALEKKWRGLILYLSCCLLIFGGMMGLRYVFVNTGSFGRIVAICCEYNHILPFLGAVGLFMAFLGLRLSERISVPVCAIAPHTLGVYLLHENLGLRYTWQKWLGADRIQGMAGLLLGTLVAVVVVFTVGILTDLIIDKALRLLHRGGSRITCYQRLMEKIRNVDQEFAE